MGSLGELINYHRDCTTIENQQYRLDRGPLFQSDAKRFPEQASNLVNVWFQALLFIRFPCPVIGCLFSMSIPFPRGSIYILILT